MKNHPVLCVIEGFVIQYSYMSAVFWLSSLSFFMWKVFRRIKPTVNTGKNLRWGFQHKSYKKYALYAWGCPLIVTVVTITMQFLPKDQTEKFYRPDIGVRQCFLKPKESTLFYFHIVNAPILVCLVLIFTVKPHFSS